MNNTLLGKTKKMKRFIKSPKITIAHIIVLFVGMFFGYLDHGFVTYSLLENILTYILLFGLFEFLLIFLLVFLIITRALPDKLALEFKSFFIIATGFCVLGHALGNLLAFGQLNYFHVVGLFIFNTAGTFAAYYTKHRLHS